MKNLYNIIKNHLIRYPTPLNINFNWSYGSIAGIFLIIQIITGILLAFHYVPHPDAAFYSIERIIMRDVHNGWLVRYMHMNGASFFFLAVYFHMARSLYYRTYLNNTYAWYSGLFLFIVLMATAFVGYVLPWSQMSYWAATVITNLFSSIPFIGTKVVYWIWGGYSVSESTLKRFFTLHFVFSAVLVLLSIIHIYFIHLKGSSKPVSAAGYENSISFGAYFSTKDIYSFLALFLVFMFIVLIHPLYLAHPDQFIKADVLVTPKHIVPEWYFSPFYAILRSVPSKGLGIFLLGSSLVILFFLPKIDAGKVALHPKYNIQYEVLFFIFIYIFLMLGYLGSMPATEPYVLASKIFTFLYFFYFFVLFIISRRDNKLLLGTLESNSSSIEKKKND